jgi:hypothetical protein
LATCCLLGTRSWWHHRTDSAAPGRDLSTPEFTDAEATRWWNNAVYPQLGGRTATQAWFACDYDAVKAIVEHLVSERFADALKNRPDVARRLLDAPSAS